EPAGGVQEREVQQPQVVSVEVVTADPLVVVDEVAAAVKDEPLAVDLDRAGVMRRVAVDEVGPGVDELLRQPDLVHGDLVPPIGSPVNGDYDDVAAPFRPAHLANQRGDGIAGQVVDPWAIRAGLPRRRNAAGGHAEGDYLHPGTGCDSHIRGLG